MRAVAEHEVGAGIDHRMREYRQIATLFAEE